MSTKQSELLEAVGRVRLNEFGSFAERFERNDLLAASEALASGALVEVRSDTAKASALAQTALFLAELAQDERTLALALRANGNVRHASGQQREAADFHHQALAIFEKLGDPLETGRTLSTSLQPLILLGRYQEALERAARAKQLFEQAGDGLRLARLEVNVGNIYHRMDRFQEAIEHYDRAYPVLLGADDQEGIAGVLINRAVVLMVLNRSGEAMASYERARYLCSKLKMPRLVAQADYNIAYLYYLRGQYSRALQWLQSSRLLYRELGDRYHQALCDLDEAEMYLQLNLYADAACLGEAAYGAFVEISHRYEAARALAITAIANRLLGKAVRALDLFDRAREIFLAEQNDPWLATLDLHKAVLFFEEGRHCEARALCEGARKFFSSSEHPLRLAYAELLLAQIAAALGDQAAALAAADRARQLLQNSESPWLEYQCDLILGLLAEEAGDSAAAKTHYLESVEKIEKLRAYVPSDDFKVHFFQDKTVPYESLVALALNDPRPDPGQIFRYVEMAKSRSLVDLLLNYSPRRTNEPQPGGTVSEISRLREELNWYQRKVSLEEMRTGGAGRTGEFLDKIRELENQLVAAFRHISSDAATAGSNRWNFDMAEVQATLDERTTLVEYFVVREAILALVITRRSVHVLPRIANYRRVAKVTQLLRFQLAKFGLSPGYLERFGQVLFHNTDEHLGELYRLLLEPLSPYLTTPRLVIVPHGCMHLIPFHALRGRDGYLVDRHEVIHSPSGTVYALAQRQAAVNEKKAVIFGLADEAAPQIEQEVKAVVAALPESRLFLAEKASQARLQDEGQSADIIHIATHGVFRQDNPLFSAIRLADSWLSVFDIYGLRLNANLVTLSGCGTGLAQVSSGDELIGLIRGFLAAGCRAFMGSLWAIDDETTREFMEIFYSYLRDGTGKGAALRLAMLAIRERRPHPFFWAPFFVMGKA